MRLWEARPMAMTFSVAGTLIAVGWIGAILDVGGRWIAVALTVVAVIMVAGIALVGLAEKRDHDR